MEKVKIGIMGCGNISGIYLKNCTQRFENLEVVACSDIIIEKARARAEEFNVPKVYMPEEMYADPEIKIIVNLTVPKAHAKVNLLSLEAGKNVHVEKPLATKREAGRKVIALAKQKGLLVGGAPDTFMGGGLQTCRKLIDDGWIGRPIGATAFMMGHGPEGWHPDPEFFYKEGAGPLFDMGPYYLTALISLLGPIKRVTGSANISFPERTATCKEKNGYRIKVDVATHIAGVLDFECGALATLITSFDVWNSQLPRIEMYGSEGTLSIPDPNFFDGPVLLKRHDTKDWKEIPLTHGNTDNSRGLGVSDMADALIHVRKHRANSEMTFHVLDVMQGILDASTSGSHYTPESTCTRPQPMPMGTLGGF